MSRDTQHRIAVAYGDDPETLVPLLLDECRLASRIPPGSAVGIKPNLVVAKPSATGATTDPALVEAIIVYLAKHGIDRICIMESAWLGDCTEKAFDVCGYREIAARRGVPLVDLKKDAVTQCTGGGVSMAVCRRALEVDFLINVPVLKAHSQTQITCALKNLKGVIPDDEKQRFHALGLHRPIAGLSTIVRSDFVVVDGIVTDLSHEEGGNPIAMNRILAGDDPVAIDAYAAALLGYSVSDVPYIGLAEALGVGTATIRASDVVALNSPKDAPMNVRARGLARRFADRIDAREACSPCISGLIHALTRLEANPRMRSLPKICVGQGFKGSPLEVGIGSCTKQGKYVLGGCPPSASEIVDFLKRF